MNFKIFNVQIQLKEIMTIMAVLFFTLIMNYVDVSPALTQYVKHNRYVQLLSVFVVSLFLIISYHSTFEISLNFVLNALIVTILFGFITKPREELTKTVEKIEDKVDTKIYDIKNHYEIKHFKSNLA